MKTKIKLFTFAVALIGIPSTAMGESKCYTSEMTPNASISEWADGANVLSTKLSAGAGIIAATAPATAGTSLVSASGVAAAAGAVAAVAGSVSYINNQFANNSMGAPMSIKIPWDELGTHETILSLSEDYIGIRRLPASVELLNLPSGTSGKLVLEQKGTWWKAIVTFNRMNTNMWQEIVCLQDNRKAMMIDLKPEKGEEYFVVLSKAKTFGVHTNMYEIANWKEASTKYNYIVHWYNSDEDPTSRDGVKVIKYQ